MIGPRFRRGSCRLCLWESNSLWDIFGELAERRNFARKIQACVNIIVSKDDGLSLLICPNCIYKVELFYDFQTSCKRSDEIQKCYNGFHDAERTDRDVENVLLGTTIHCGVSNTHMDAPFPVETIDIKEEPLDDDEVAAVAAAATAGVGDEQFEDAEVEVEELEAVAEDTENDGIMDVGGSTAAAAEQQKEKEKGGGDNGSCLQLTPPRSPSLESEVTCSASETEGSEERRGSPEQQADGGEEAGSNVRSDRTQPPPEAEVGGRSCKHCTKWHPDPSICLEHERDCPRRDQQEVAQLPKGKYTTQCRSCGKWFQKTGVCRIHEIVCAPERGYAAPPLPQGRGYGTRCRFCSTHFVDKACRISHEYHCFRRQYRIQSAKLPAPTCNPLLLPGPATASDPLPGSTPAELPPTVGTPTDSECQPDPCSLPAPVMEKCQLPPAAKYINQCRFCKKYFPRMAQRYLHEMECGPRLGYPAPPPPLLPAGSLRGRRPGDRKCTLCSKQFKTLAGLMSHEHSCQRNSLKMSRVARLRDFFNKRVVRLPGPTRHNMSANQCRYCQSRFPSVPQRVSHEYSCAKESGWFNGPGTSTRLQAGEQDTPASIKCRYCGKGHLKWRSLLMHEFHCRRKAPPQTTTDADGKVETEGPAGSGDGSGADENGSLAESGTSEEKKKEPHNRCTHCHKWLRSKRECKLHEKYCFRSLLIARPRYRERYTCSHCSRIFLKRSSCVMHERYCPKAAHRTGDSRAMSKPEQQQQQKQKQTLEEQQQLGSTVCNTSAPQSDSTDRKEIMSSKSESEEKRKKMESPLCLPVATSTKEADVWACRYCDKLFKYRECLRTHEVKCSAIATYQYTTPHYRPPTLFTCPHCRKAFKFRRKLHNHWKVCMGRTSVTAEAAELNGIAKPARGGPEELVESDRTVVPDGVALSPGEEWGQWRGWPSGHSAESLTDEDSSTADSSGLSCKLCHKDFCSRVLLELHTLNECVYQRIRNDHAYAQCESAGVDESTLMRMARVELQRLLLCSCCGSIFRDQEALTNHELAERHGRPLPESDLSLESVEDETRDDPEAGRLEKKIKLEKLIGSMCWKLEVGGQQESSCSTVQLTESDKAVPTSDKQLEKADSRRESNKNCLLREILLGADCNQLLLTGSPEKHIKHFYSEDGKTKLEIKNEGLVFQQQERQQSESAEEEGLIKDSVLLHLLATSSTDGYQEQLKEDNSKMFSLANSGTGQGNQTEGAHLQPLNRLQNVTLLLQQQRLETLKRRHDQHCVDNTKQKMQLPKISGSHDTIESQGGND